MVREQDCTVIWFGGKGNANECLHWKRMMRHYGGKGMGVFDEIFQW